MRLPNKALGIIKSIVIPCIIFLSLTTIFNYEVVKNFSSSIEKNDGRLLAWTLAWDNHKLLTDVSTIFQANIYYPNENTLTYSEHAFGISLLSLPAYIISNGNPVIGFNFVLLLCYFLNALTTYFLVKYLTRSKSAGILAGVIFAFCSYKILNFGHLQNLPVFYMPILLLCLYRYFDTRRIRYLTGIGLCLLLQSLSSWYHMIFIFLLFAIFLLFFIYLRKFSKQDFIRFTVMLISVGVVLIPFAIPYFQFNKENQSAYSMEELKMYSADLGGYLMPSPNTLGSLLLEKINITKTSWFENFNFIGYITLLLSLISFIEIRRVNGFELFIKFDKRKFIFLLCGLIFLVLSFGPFLRISDVTSKIPLPYLAIYNLLTPIRFIRAVSRFSTVVFLMTSILAAFGYLKVSANLKSASSRIFLFVGLLILIPLEFFPFHDYRQFADVGTIPQIYTEIKNSDDIKALVELPMNVGPFVTTGYVYWAGYHLKPIVNGYSGYEPKTYRDIVNITTQFPDSISLIKLHEMGVSHLLVNPEYKESLQTTYLDLIEDKDGYKLYRIKDNIDKLSFYYDNFNNTYTQNFGKVTYIHNNTEITPATSYTPVSNISLLNANSSGVLEIKSVNMINKIALTFRTYSSKDSLKVICNESQQYDLSNNPENYLEEDLELECNSNNIRLEMYADESKDRVFISTIALF